MGKKFYAVKKGKVPGIYATWGECSENVNGFPGAIYKGFATKKEAEEFIGASQQDSTGEEEIARVYSESDAIAYVDGSYDDLKKQYSCGVIIFFNGGEERFAEKFSDPDMVEMRNVAGEIEGAKRAMRFCIENGIKSIDIIYDYEGIEKWCTGAWQAKKDGTKAYKKFYNEVKKSVDINFVKVKGHSGNTYNELADSLAKSALGIGDLQKITVRDNGILANKIKYDDLKGIIELLKEDFEDFECSDENEIPYGIQFEISIKIPTSQKLKINYYNGKNKLWIQGKKEDLFNRLSLYIIELLEVDEIPDFLNTVHNLDIDKDVVGTEFTNYFPNSYNLIPKDVKKYLHQAVYNLHIMGKMYVTNFLSEPAIRSLEPILKVALKDNDIPIRKEGNDYDSFFVFEKKDNKYKLKESYKKDKHSKQLLNYLSKYYTFFHDNRHTLSHWDDPTATIDTTRILNTVEEAHTLIRDSIKLIDEYYTIK
ncbi:viroplasmin family protein [Clostridium chromiireducens]|uniref:ribonuclease H1 domain-containing protein n=1 Tax=Clostridium chromiireducens TaxID=225345 RepID=UPI003AF6955B